MDTKDLLSNGYNYTHRDIDFGEEGKLMTPDRNATIQWFYTYRDGIFVQIKHLSPYSIVFELFDGSYFINTKDESMQNFLKKFREDLSNLRDKIKRGTCRYPYQELEGIIFARMEAFLSRAKTI